MHQLILLMHNRRWYTFTICERLSNMSSQFHSIVMSVLFNTKCFMKNLYAPSCSISTRFQMPSCNGALVNSENNNYYLHEMGRACSTHGQISNPNRILVWKPEETDSSGDTYVDGMKTLEQILRRESPWLLNKYLYFMAGSTLLYLFTVQLKTLSVAQTAQRQMIWKIYVRTVHLRDKNRTQNTPRTEQTRQLLSSDVPYSGSIFTY